VATHNLIVHGAGGHARVVIDSALAQGHHVVAIFDPNCMGELYGIPIKQDYNMNEHIDVHAVVAIGDNAARHNVASMIRHPFVNIIHPSAVYSPFSIIGHGNVMLQGAIVQAESRIGNHVILNTGAQVDHDCVIEDFVHIAPGVILCGNVRVGEGTFMGAGSIVIPGKKIGAWSIIGAGSVVIDNIPDNVVAVGNPARVIKHVNLSSRQKA
jgi:sugar O-acyltransferase (sialic acid O-acetyltransferase NeuD family)